MKKKTINKESIEDVKINKTKSKLLKKWMILRALILLTILLIFNAYAWFVYATKVSGGLTAHVTSWNVEFKVGDNVVVKEIFIDVEKIFPGMPEYKKEIKVRNAGEMGAHLDYYFKSLTILGENYTVGENCTEIELKNKINNDYPFKIKVAMSNIDLTPNIQEGTFTITVNWPFESGNDLIDTNWGEKAYDFKAKNPNESSLKIALELIAEQKEKNK